jgi:transposase
MVTRYDLTDPQWERLAPILPPQKPKTGKPNNDHRPILNGILWLKRTGAPWRDIPDCYGPWSTIASRFYRWCKLGIWQQIWDTLQQEADAAEQIDWETHYVDGTVVRAHQHAAGAHDTTPDEEALGRSKGGFSTKIHIRAEGGGKPMTFVLTAGQRHEAVMFEQLMEQGAVKRVGRGRPRRRPRRVVGDKGYSSRKIRAYLRSHHIRYTIPRKQNERCTGPFDRAIYRTRNRVERLINRLKQSRRIATRYEKCAVYYMAMLTIAAIQFWL